LNAFTVLDLYFTLSSPFSSTKSRERNILVSTIVLSFLLAAGGMYLTKSKVDFISDLNLLVYEYFAFGNIFLSVIILIFVRIRLQRPGMSGNLKQQISRRYLEFVMVFAIFSWPICYFTKPTYKWSNEYQTFWGGTKYVANWNAIVFLSGIVVAITRIRDPLILEKIKLLSCFKKKDSSELEKQVIKTDLNAFLKTSLNTELVISILKGITILAATSSENVDHLPESDMLQVR